MDSAWPGGEDRAVTNLDQLEAIVAETDEERRWDALRVFARGEPSQARAVGEHGLSSGDARIRTVAADVLGAVASVDPASAARIAEVLTPRLEVERDLAALDSVIVALGHTGDPRARVGVLRYAEHPDAEIRFDVAWSLPSFGLDRASLAVLRRLSVDVDDDVRDWATFGLANSDDQDPATIEALAARADDPHNDTRAEAIYGLARRHDERAMSLIQRELARPFHGELIERALEELEG
jgi:hypothetical protein